LSPQGVAIIAAPFIFMDTQAILQHILQHKIVAIIRGADPASLSQVAEALYDGGVRTIEVTVNSLQPMEAIAALSKQMAGKMRIGAGTVLDPETARLALLAGAEYIISPTFCAATISMTKRYGAVSIPGAMTPTEILAAYNAGGDIIKVFPASTGTALFKEMQGPLPHIPLMPTGGVNLDNIKSYKDAGAVAYGLGSSLVNTKIPVSAESLEAIRDSARAFIQAVES
jgi:2-dehydro-3-deoxyphosphogluconate aldolase/(4S)-4-hydroxy-2-oxoglutarate aldolase